MFNVFVIKFQFQWKGQSIIPYECLTARCNEFALIESETCHGNKEIYNQIRNPYQNVTLLATLIGRQKNCSGDLTFAWTFLAICFFTWATALKDKTLSVVISGQNLIISAPDKQQKLPIHLTPSPTPLLVTMAIWKFIWAMFLIWLKTP